MRSSTTPKFWRRGVQRTLAFVGVGLMLVAGSEAALATVAGENSEVASEVVTEEPTPDAVEGLVEESFDDEILESEEVPSTDAVTETPSESEITDMLPPGIVYELQGHWQDSTPSTVEYGEFLASEWRFNINDGSPAPSNDPVDNVTVTFTATNGVFTALPAACLVEEVAPESSISSDGGTLTCNLGTRNQGTAEFMLTGFEAQGNSGDEIVLAGSIGHAVAELTPITIQNEFRMDVKIDGGVRSVRDGPRDQFFIPWSVRHAPGANAGPSSITIPLRISSNANPDPVRGLLPGGASCAPIDAIYAGHPYSEQGRPPAQTASFASCTLTRQSNTQWTLTITGLDYSSESPTHDSAGNALEHGWNVIASGRIAVRWTYSSAAVVSVTMAPPLPVYTSVQGETFTDIASNNSNSRSFTRGVWSGGWRLNSMNPRVEGSTWQDDFRVPAGANVLQIAAVRPPQGSENSTQACAIIDPRYVDMVDASAGVISAGIVTPYPSGVTLHYYTGTNYRLNPDHILYNPNSFDCSIATGWSTVRPADMSQVRAVRAVFTAAVEPHESGNVANLYVTSKIKDDVSVGQDIWAWTSYRTGTNNWQTPHRDSNTGSITGSGVLTPNSRYAFTGGGRDVIRVIDAVPVLTKTVDQNLTAPGAALTYTLNYRANGIAGSTAAVTVTDVLPAGMEYIPGSASIAPSTVSGQTLTWNLSGVPVAEDHAITFSARVPISAEPGETFTNTATATIGSRSSNDSAMSQIVDGGYTTLTKTAEQQTVPHADGVAEGSWTLRVSSMDSRTQSFTDTIDVLPYNADGRGTTFEGTYTLSGPVTAVAGATVYYTTADPALISEDPADASNGSAGDVNGNTIGWTTTFTPEATGIRVIGPALAPGDVHEATISIITQNAAFEDIYVNRAESRAGRTELPMRTSSWLQIGAVNSVSLKKYVQDSDGDWRDANNIDDYPTYTPGAKVPYRLIVENTGDEVLNDLQLDDDLYDLANLDPVPDGLMTGAVISTIAPGDSVTIEYTITLDIDVSEQIVNTACVVVEEANLDSVCDPAGIIVAPILDTSFLLEKWGSGSAGEDVLFGGSQWAVYADEDGAPSEMPIEDVITPVDGVDGQFTLTLSPGDYWLVETQAPEGFQLLAQPVPFTVTSSQQIVMDGVDADSRPVALIPGSEDDPFTIQVFDVPAFDLPVTGGSGEMPFLISGLLLLLAAAAGFGYLSARRQELPTTV